VTTVTHMSILETLLEHSKMKITKRQLKRIIKEEKAKLIAETKVRKLVRRKLTLRENATPEGTVGAYVTDGIRTEIEPIDADLMGTGPSIQWSSDDLTSPDAIAAMSKAVSLYGDLEILDDPEGLSEIGTPVWEWLMAYIKDMQPEQANEILEDIGI
jgi:hypothetical protein